MVPVTAGLGHRQLLRASVNPAQELSGGYRNRLVVHGKEEVCGSLP